MMIRARRGPTRLPKYGQPRDIHFRSGGQPPKRGGCRRLFGLAVFALALLAVPAAVVGGFVWGVVA
jgi:hypothetical protein